jgi:hypothetical protein
LVDDEVIIFTNMTKVVKEVAATIGDNKHVDVHPDLYTAAMDAALFRGWLSWWLCVTSSTTRLTSRKHGLCLELPGALAPVGLQT